MFRKFLFSDSKGEKSVTLSAFVWGFVVVNFKLLISGVTIMGYTMTPFSGTEYGIALSALGAIYILRRNTDPENKKETVI